ncbi:N-acetylgalactosaminyltransferase 7-like [Diadema setosum]|uniref:N-acetylgalactosaminyltransferase 7-like n=1 Tax=Diadema setosum TaxID=31175 RepID=UPI003B3B956E
MAPSYFGGTGGVGLGRLSAPSRPRRGLQFVLGVILLVGSVPILIIVSSDSSTAASSLSRGNDARLVEGWVKDEEGKPWGNAVSQTHRGSYGGRHGGKEGGERVKGVQGQNRQLQHEELSVDRARQQTSDQSQTSRQSNGVARPVLRKSLGNFEPRDQPVRNGLGEYGLGVHLQRSEQPLYDRAIEEYGFNMVISDRISLDRAVADLRDRECRHWHYSTNLPNASVVIIFHNEGWSTLLRTIHSIFNTSPPQFLAEVLLVDDFSDKAHLKTKLEEYLLQPRFSGKARIVRNTRREGLIRSRTIGARAAVGQVLVFLDAHCECAPNWLPPLLAEIALNRTTVVCPTVDAISADNFAYGSQGDGLCRGAFDWDFWYKRIPVRKSRHRLGLKHSSQPYPSPVMAGGLFALDRSFFFQLGGYDPGLQIWGGENFEISFKTWMCGGSLKFVPCSRVGHIYRKQVPYTYPHSGVEGVSVVDLNYMRVAEVWLDEYKDFFYATKPQLEGKSCGNLSEQVAFRRDHCQRSFSWFMEEVAFDTLEEYPPPAKNKIWGEVRSVDSELCLDTNGAQSNPKAVMAMAGCHGMGGNQLFRINTRGQMAVEDGYCLFAKADSTKIMFVRCAAEKFPTTDDTEWDYDPEEKIIYLGHRRRCLDHDQVTNRVFVAPCEKGKLSQEFKFYKDAMR